MFCILNGGNGTLDLLYIAGWAQQVSFIYPYTVVSYY